MKPTVARPPAAPQDQDMASQILEAACRCMSTKGYAKTTIDDVSKAANASTGSVYHAFKKGKRQIGEEVYRRWTSDLCSAVEPADILRARSLEDFLAKRLLHSYCRWFTEDRPRAAFIFEFEVAATGTESRMAINDARRGLQEGVCRALSRANEKLHVGNHLLPAVEAVILGPPRLLIGAWICANTGSPPPNQQIPWLAKSAAAALTALLPPDPDPF